MLIVKKFGGTSVADKERIFNVAKRCIRDYQNGNDVVVVLSAMGKYTDELIAKAKEINPNPSKREMDMLFTIGEQVSLMAMAMDALGVRAISLNAFQVAMHTTSNYSNARLKKIDTERIRRELDDRKIVIVTGFQGINKYNDYTTLGRGGSDTTAVALAAALHADACEIYTDVDGVYTADPRLVPTARKLNAITYDEMLDLATLGAGVLHNRSVEMAKKYGVPLVVRSSLNESEGTVVKEVVKKMERMLISGVALDKDADRISVIGIKDAPGSAFKLFNTLAKKNINVDIIIQSVGREGTKDISFTVAHDNLKEAIELLEEYQEVLGFERVDYNCEVAKLSIVGAGMMSNPGVAAKMFECLYNENVNINMIATSEIRITVLVNSEDAVRAMNAVHDAQNDTVRSPFYAAALKTKMRNLKAQDRRLEKEGYAHVDSVEEAIDVFFQCEGFPKSRRILEFHLEELKTDVSTLLQDIHITLYGRQKTVIAGENGCGKSLLMKEIHKVLKSHTDIRLGYMPQNYAEAFSAKDTPVTFLLEACDRDDITRARELLGRMKFTREEMEHSVYQLSEGQKAKLYLLRFIKQGCNVLLLDEPTRNLSPLTSPVIRRILKDFPGCILAVSHDRLFIQEVFDSVLYVAQGELQVLETEQFMEALG